jgi:hypothetical protein
MSCRTMAGHAKQREAEEMCPNLFIILINPLMPAPEAPNYLWYFVSLTTRERLQRKPHLQCPPYEYHPELFITVSRAPSGRKKGHHPTT